MATAVTRQASTTSATQVLAENALRRGAIFVNDDANRAYVLLGPGTVSATNYTFSLAQNENACPPRELCGLRISAIWGTAGSGGLNITEEC